MVNSRKTTRTTTGAGGGIIMSRQRGVVLIMMSILAPFLVVMHLFAPGGSNLFAYCSSESPTKIQLPAVRTDSAFSLEKAMAARRSIRSYFPGNLTLSEVSQLLWAAQGINRAGTKYRTAPSAGALYPLEMYIVVGRVDGLLAGVYHYSPQSNELTLVKAGDYREAIQAVSLHQGAIGDSAAVLVFTALYNRTTVKYGVRGIRYVHIEVGHAAQNVALQAAALDLGGVTIGAFSDSAVQDVLGSVGEPLDLMPIGRLSAQRENSLTNSAGSSHYCRLSSLVPLAMYFTVFLLVFLW